MCNQDCVGNGVAVKPRLHIEVVAERFAVLRDGLRAIVDQRIGVGALLLFLLDPCVLVKGLILFLISMTVLLFLVLKEEIVKSVHFIPTFPCFFSVFSFFRDLCAERFLSWFFLRSVLPPAAFRL